MDENFPAYNCPNCGSGIELHFRQTKMLTCPSCGTGLFLEDDAVKNAGVSSVMADYPSIFKLFNSYKYRNWQFMPVGRLRFEYAHGEWDEWWVTSGDEGKWVSVDEGDIAIEVPAEVSNPPFLPDLQPGKKIDFMGQQFLVTERGTATCIGIEGELPEAHQIGDRYEYVHLRADKGVLYTLEFEDGNVFCHKGSWVDPFDVKAL